MWEPDQQQCRDLRERLNSRRQQDTCRQECGRARQSRSRSAHADKEDGVETAVRSGHHSSRRQRSRDHSASSWPRWWPEDGASERSRRLDSSSSTGAPFVRETDPVILARRQKQVDYGMNTLCYQEYIQTVPRHQRRPYHPRTPDKTRQTSRRRWDSAIKNWRIQLHYWNDPVKLAKLRSRRNSDSELSDWEPPGPASSGAVPKPEPADAGAESALVLPPGTVKREPLSTGAAAAKAERPQLEAIQPALLPAARRPAKQEPLSTGAAAVKAERPPLEAIQPALLPAARRLAKQEPPSAGGPPVKTDKWRPPAAGQDLPAEAEHPVKEEPVSQEDEDGVDRLLTWADDVEGLAQELTDDLC
ncbi:uncharacterized protein LOC119112908 [Pollicipes pollicipes]|uniref:uncharacterized protein LOC119112908 n=1 Tax=Pollicipes pollicipes TaxID=41117 RepID=UPI001884D17C|nr:uncharacterized protein LOC119112908 [Pollicipes pollicipes]